MRRGLTIKTKLSFVVLLISVVSSLLVGSSSYYYFSRNLKEYMGVKARDVALTVSVTIDGDEIKKYDKTGDKDAYYMTLCDYLTSVKSSVQMTYLYIMTDDGDNFKYIAEGGSDPAQLGDTQPKGDYGQEPMTTLNTGVATYSEIYNNSEYGNLLSGFAPINDSTGNIVGIVGLDFGTAIINKSIAVFLPVIAMIVVGASILSYLFIYWIITRLVARPIKVIEEAAGKLSNYDFSVEVPEKYLNRKDELGRLSLTIKNMADDLQKIIDDISIVLAEMS